MATWLRFVLLFTLLFIGHVLQIALHIQGLPGIPGFVLFPFIIPALIEEYRTAIVFTAHPNANWPMIDQASVHVCSLTATLPLTSTVSGL